MSKTSDGHHYLALDGLRGVAIFSVLCFHMLVAESLPPRGIGKLIIPIAKMGWAGVDLFFVLSGFLITGILLRARTATNYYKVFYARRVLRIFPVYYLFVILLFCVAVRLQHHGGFFALHPIGTFGSHEQLWYWINLSNLRTAFYPLLIPMASPLWSLAIEEQFYLVWPAIARNLRERSLMVLCVTGIVLSAVLRNLPWIQHWNTIYPNLIYRLTPLHMDGLLFGGVLAMLLPRYGDSRTARKVFVGLLCGTAAVLVCLSRTPFPEAPAMTRIGYSVLALFAGSLLWLSVAKSGSKMLRHIFSWKPLVQLGKYSYFIYVFHIPLYVYGWILADHFLRRFGITTDHPYLFHYCWALVSFTIIYAIAALSWRIFEGPILSRKRFFEYRFPSGTHT